MARVCVRRSMWCRVGKQHFPSGIVKRGRAFKEMQRHSKLDRAQARAAAGVPGE